MRFTGWFRMVCSINMHPEVIAMHLLIVEDDLEPGAEAQRRLAARSFTCEWVRQARDARARVKQQSESPFACAVQDLGLPDGQGLDVLRDWCERGVTLPVIVLTARNDLTSRVAGLDGGADDYAIKPVQPEELASRVRAVTRRVSGQSSAVLSVGRLQIDMRAHEVRASGVAVALSPKEFGGVVELARHAGSVVPKHRIARAVEPFEPLEFHALEVHIHNLRRKLGADAIRAVRYSLAT
jgi:two-component system, OmpR family, response regulator QseB